MTWSGCIVGILEAISVSISGITVAQMMNKGVLCFENITKARKDASSRVLIGSVALSFTCAGSYVTKYEQSEINCREQTKNILSRGDKNAITSSRMLLNSKMTGSEAA